MRNDFFYYHADRYIAKDPSLLEPRAFQLFFPLKRYKSIIFKFFSPNISERRNRIDYLFVDFFFVLHTVTFCLLLCFL